jgi:hypothetical protein
MAAGERKTTTTATTTATTAGAGPHAGPGASAVVVDLAAARARRARAGGGERLLAEVERELAGARERLGALAASGALFAREGGREGRRVLLAQEALLEARRLLLEATGGGALPAPRQDATRERLTGSADGLLAQARRRLAPQAAPGGPTDGAAPLPRG